MLPQTGVTFSGDDAALQKLFDEAERKCLHNLKDFGADTVLVEGGGYEKIWLETQPMGGEMYWKRNMTAAMNNQVSGLLRPVARAEHVVSLRQRTGVSGYAGGLLREVRCVSLENARFRRRRMP